MSASDRQEWAASSPIRVLAVSLHHSDLDEPSRSLLVRLGSRLHIDQMDALTWGHEPPFEGEYDLILLGSGSNMVSIAQAEKFRSGVGAGLALLLGGESRMLPEPTEEDFFANVWVVPHQETRRVLHWAVGQCAERKRMRAHERRAEAQLREAVDRVEVADVASTVLHNVGNVLTSVNVAGKVIEEMTTQSSVVLINRMSDLLKDHEQDWVSFLSVDPKGKKVLPLLQRLGRHLMEEQQAVLKEIRGLLRHLSHVRSIIVSHQTMARAQGFVEAVSIEKLLEQAMELSFQPVDFQWLTVRRQFEDVPPVLVDSHQMLQVLVNLFRNAKQAMQQQSRSAHTFTLTTRVRSDGVQHGVEVTVRDTGIGIAPDHLERMFKRGFTTKKDGNGIGLSSSLSTLEKLGGSLSVTSEGIGLGATFTLILPAALEGIPA